MLGNFFEDLEYEGGMWSFAPGFGFGLIKGSTFSTIPSGYSINIITPYGFDIGPLYYNISFAIGSFQADYNQVFTDNIGITTGDTLVTINPFYFGIGGDLNFSESVYSEGHLGMVGSGFHTPAAPAAPAWDIRRSSTVGMRWQEEVEA